jgi:hypothetical protein
LGDEKIYSAVARVTGPEIPKTFPKKYTENLQPVELFNASMAFEVNELVRWEERHDIRVHEEPLKVFKDYIDTGFTVPVWLIEHPNVPDIQRFVACSVVLQRGIIVYQNGVETLFIRSYIHSADQANISLDSKQPETFVKVSQGASQRRNFVNFFPLTGVKMVFETEDIWFPLETTRLIEEPASYVVLDILTPTALDTKQLPKPFRLDKTGRMQWGGSAYYVARISAKLPREKVSDLKLKSK